MKGGYDQVLFRSETTTEEEIQHGNMKLYLDTSYDKERHARNWGTVVQVPRALSKKKIIGQEPQGWPRPAEPDFKWIYIDAISQDVQIGDKIYFHYNTLLHPNVVTEDIYAVSYDMIYCAVREHSRVVKQDGIVVDHEVGKQIIPIGGHVLIEPIGETWDDITTDSGIITKSSPDRVDRQGIVAHIGAPLEGEYQELEYGDKVLFRANADMLVTIEGKDYYVMKKKHIYVKWLRSTGTA